MGSESREQMIRSADQLLRERGLAGTSFRAVVAHSGAPRGSIAHHFPGGKDQLITEAIGRAGAGTERLITDAGEHRDPVATLRAFVDLWAGTLERSGYRAGCPVLAVTAAAGDEEAALRGAAAAAFARWHVALAEGLRDAGVPSARARSLATTVIAAVEGAVVLARAQRGGQPLRDAGAELERLVRGALPA